jgi:hypothetical protein
MISIRAASALRTVQCGSGWVSGTPGEHQAVKSRQSVLKSRPGCPPRRAKRLGIVVEGSNPRAAGDQRSRGDAAASAQPEDGDTFAGKRRDRDHQRIFKLDRPRSASMTEMIQKRITICGSVQPRCSK